MFLVLTDYDEVWSMLSMRCCMGYLSLYGGSKSTNGGYGGLSHYFDEQAN